MRVLLCGASVALLVFFSTLPRLILRIWKLCFHGINRVSHFMFFHSMLLFFRGNGKNSNLSLTLHALVRLLVSLTHSVSTQFFSSRWRVIYHFHETPVSPPVRCLTCVERRFWCLADHQQHPSLFCSFLSLGCTTAKADIHKLTTHTQEQQQQQKTSQRHDGWDILREWGRRMKSKNIAKISCQADARKDDSTGGKETRKKLAISWRLFLANEHRERVNEPSFILESRHIFPSEILFLDIQLRDRRWVDGETQSLARHRHMAATVAVLLQWRCRQRSTLTDWLWVNQRVRKWMLWRISRAWNGWKRKNIDNENNLSASISLSL